MTTRELIEANSFHRGLSEIITYSLPINQYRMITTANFITKSQFILCLKKFESQKEKKLKVEFEISDQSDN